MTRNIARVACVGAGLIGQGWSVLFSSRGREVILQDVSEAVLDKALSGIAGNLAFLEQKGLLKKGEAEAALTRIQTTLNLEEAVHGADYVQESVPEDYGLKKKIFQQMDGAAPEYSILASSTSGLLMSEIQEATSRPERCVLVHPVLPVYLIPLVEIAGGRKTSRKVLEATDTFMKGLGKSPVVLKREVPGYIINRLQAALMREAIDLLDRGIASAEDIDRAFCTGIGLRDPLVGPFLRMHLAGNGIERFIENFSQSYHHRWATMESWTSISPSAAQTMARETRKMEAVRTKTLPEIRGWRDEMLIRIIRLIQENELCRGAQGGT